MAFARKRLSKLPQLAAGACLLIFVYHLLASYQGVAFLPNTKDTARERSNIDGAAHTAATAAARTAATAAAPPATGVKAVEATPHDVNSHTDAASSGEGGGGHAVERGGWRADPPHSECCNWLGRTEMEYCATAASHWCQQINATTNVPKNFLFWHASNLLPLELSCEKSAGRHVTAR